jgi:phospholipid/cholesterol/gamma-HCH transport system permease protein
MTSTQASFKPLHALGGFHAMALDHVGAHPPQALCVAGVLAAALVLARVSMPPTVMLAIPFTVLLIFTFNILLVEFGTVDYSGGPRARRRSSHGHVT